MLNSVVLVGFMGAGKTTVGAKLVPRINTYQHDLDQVIETQLGQSIQEYFAQHGEVAFRQLETQILTDQLTRCGILSTGGGVVMSEVNRDLLKRTPVPVVYLRTQASELLQRLQGDADRPLLKQLDQEGFLELWQYREPLYQEVADLVVDTDELTADQVATLIMEQLECGRG